MSISATCMTGRDVGGRPVSAKSRKSKLITDLIRMVGPENLTPLTQEAVLNAADLTIAAQTARAKITDATPASELMATLALIEAADRALGKLGLSSEPPARPRPTTLAGAMADALETGVISTAAV